MAISSGRRLLLQGVRGRTAWRYFGSLVQRSSISRAYLQPAPSVGGIDGRQRYAAVLADAMRQVAGEPKGPLTKNRTELRSGIRSFHVQYAHRSADAAKVRRPVHVLYFRVAQQGVIEIVRVLHERMDPIRHLDESLTDGDI